MSLSVHIRVHIHTHTHIYTYIYIYPSYHCCIAPVFRYGKCFCKVSTACQVDTSIHKGLGHAASRNVLLKTFIVWNKTKVWKAKHWFEAFSLPPPPRPRRCLVMFWVTSAPPPWVLEVRSELLLLQASKTQSTPGRHPAPPGPMPAMGLRPLKHQPCLSTAGA